ncbi:hypothetical protein [Aliiroseovarius marinus]|uniref:hypothetical protein n=1 Tax=Aliiroseovarius marinus TaxID=2500159 RepID=UPI0024950569|nr:hypothetical protein [Aliiroseovarius marinus]
MSEKTTSYSEVVSFLTLSIPLLPIAGFILSFAYEWTFFLHLGIDFRDVLDIADFVRGSLLNVVPVLIPAGIGAWMAHFPATKARTKGPRTLYFWVFILPFLALYLVIVLLFTLFGAIPEIGIQFLYVAIPVVLIGFFSRSFSERALGSFGIIARLYLIFVFAIAGYGAQEAYQLRSGDTNKLITINEITQMDALPDDVALVRRLSTSAIVVSASSESLFIVDTAQSLIVSHRLNTSPPRGLLCIAFSWCDLNRWSR